MRWMAALVLALVVGGCGSTVDETPSAAPISGPPATGVCAAIPTVDPNNPPASLPLTSDPTLEQKFPTELDGQPVTSLASGRWIELLCMAGGQTYVDAAGQSLPPGLDLSPMTVASADATVDGNDVMIVAFRLPGGSAASLLAIVGRLSDAISPGQPKFTTELTQTTAGGKSVSTWSDPVDETVSYLYSSGDTLWLVDSIDQSQADKIFAALP